MKHFTLILLFICLGPGSALANGASIEHDTCIINYSIENSDRTAVDPKLHEVLVSELLQKGYTPISSNGYLQALPFPLLVINVRFNGDQISPLSISAAGEPLSIEAEMELLVRTNIRPEVLFPIFKKNQVFQTLGKRRDLEKALRTFVTGIPKCTQK